MILRTIFAALALVLSVSANNAHAQTTLTLRPSAVIETGTGGTLTLADIARIEGGLNSKLSQVTIAVPANGKVTAAIVDQAIINAGLRSGGIAINGSECRITYVKPLVPATYAPEIQPTVINTDDAANQATIKGSVVRYLANDLRSLVQDINITFDTRDTPLLDTDSTGLDIAIAPAGDGANGATKSLSIRGYQSGVSVVSGVIRVRVQVRREVMIATANLSRGDLLDSSFSTESRFVDYNERPAMVDSAEGAIAASAIRTGKIIRERDLVAAVAVKKGQLLMVETVSGGVALRIRALATQDARPGDEITVRTQPWNSPIRVRVNRAGNATALGPVPETRKGSANKRQLAATTE